MEFAHYDTILWLRVPRPGKSRLNATVQRSFVDESGKYLVNIDAYIFAPKFDKREYLRELEAISLSAVSKI